MGDANRPAEALPRRLKAPKVVVLKAQAWIDAVALPAQAKSPWKPLGADQICFQIVCACAPQTCRSLSVCLSACLPVCLSACLSEHTSALLLE